MRIGKLEILWTWGCWIWNIANSECSFDIDLGCLGIYWEK